VIAAGDEAVADRVLSAARPAFSEADAAEIARQLFGVEGSAVEVDPDRHWHLW
jgi:hypothetical protein